MKAAKRLYKTIEFVPVVTAVQYSSGDVLWDTVELPLAFPHNGGTVTLEEVFVFDRDDQGVEMDIVFLDADVSLGTVNAVVDILATEATAIVGFITLATWEDMLAFKMAWIRPANVGEVMKSAAASRSLYVAGISRGTPTHSVGGLTVRIVVSHEGTT